MTDKTQRDALMDAARVYMQRWADHLAANPEASQTAVSRAMDAGELPPSPNETTAENLTAVTRLPAFDNSPLSAAYHAILHVIVSEDELSNGRILTRHKRPAMWAAWEAHRGDGGLIEMVGLPKTNIGIAAVLGVSRRSITNYAHKYGHLIDALTETTINKLLGSYRIGAVKAMGSVVTDPDHKQFSTSQRTFFAMTGDLDKGASGTAEDPVHAVGMTMGEWQGEQQRRREEAAETAVLFDAEGIEGIEDDLAT